MQTSFYKSVYGRRGELVGIPVLIAFLVSWRGYENETLVGIVGGLVFLAGLAIRIWAQQYIHFRLKIGDKLTTHGPYAIVRNPIYIGNAAICVGLTIASNVLWMVPITVLMCLMVFPLVVRYEEARLTELYGEEYIAYTRRVPRWFPRLASVGRLQWTNEYLPSAVRVEAYNLLFLTPLILKIFLK